MKKTYKNHIVTAKSIDGGFFRYDVTITDRKTGETTLIPAVYLDLGEEYGRCLEIGYRRFKANKKAVA